jgi:hypothetical protein
VKSGLESIDPVDVGKPEDIADVIADLYRTGRHSFRAR